MLLGTLALVPDEPDQDTADEAPEPEDAEDGRVFSAYGIASAALGVVCVAAIVLGTIIFAQHRTNTDTFEYQGRVVQAAAEWTSVLINMNSENIDANLQKLYEGTVGRLNEDFDKTMQPYREVVRTLQSRSTGQINSVSIEAVHNDLDRDPGGPPPDDPLQGGLASRTDTVLIIATSVAENAGAKPQTIQWFLRVGVSDVDDKLLISRLEWIR